MRARKETTSKRQQIISILCFLIVPLFFTILYFMMFMSYEDIFQKNMSANSSLSETLTYVYNYIPRIGEFYQRTAVRYMTITPSFSLDIFFRLMDVFFSTMLVYTCTYFILGRKPVIKTKDAVIYLVLFISMLLSKTGENFTYRFSYVNNYILALLISVVFLLPFRLQIKNAKWYHCLAFTIIGFLFGISTEIMPIAFLIIAFLYSIIKIKKTRTTPIVFLKQYKLQVFETIGLLAGLAFFYLGAGLSYRTGGGYAEAYDYIGFGLLLHNPITFIYRFISHFWYNLRYIALSIPLFGFIILDLRKRLKKEASATIKKTLFWTIVIAIFNFLFVCASSLIAVHDDMYPRLLMPVLLGNLVAVLQYANIVIIKKEIKAKTLRRISIILLTVCLAMTVDMIIGFAYYHRTIDSQISKIHINGNETPDIELITEDITMKSSPIFRIKQLTPFNWDLPKFLK